MGIREKSRHKKHTTREIIPKGCLAIKVGEGDDDDQQRFVVPVFYFNHPLFMQLLNEAEKEYGFDQKGTITIPCRVEKFRHVQVLDGDVSLAGVIRVFVKLYEVSSF
ncbi:hypothetical protein ACFE04_026307 [Oxalis oulophora]